DRHRARDRLLSGRGEMSHGHRTAGGGGKCFSQLCFESPAVANHFVSFCIISIHSRSFGFVRTGSDSFALVRIRSRSFGFVRIRSPSFARPHPRKRRERERIRHTKPLLPPVRPYNGPKAC